MSNTHNPKPTVAALLAQCNQADADRKLAARHTPVIRFDAREPFLPLLMGYTVFRGDADSPSFPRQIKLAAYPKAVVAIEYAVWWDWDIEHLYELEHIWLYLDADEQLVGAEASWHGGYHNMAVNGTLPITGNRLTIYSEPGKHAFAPNKTWLIERAVKTRRSCTRHAGLGGVWVTPLFEGLITSKTPQADRLVHTWLEQHAFEPAMDFSQIFSVSPENLVPWPALQNWIPQRVAWWVAELAQTIAPAQRRILRVAHRGASAWMPENTVAAIAKAAELGADMVELDVQHSADGVPVIIHDTDLSRISRQPGLVSHRTLAELKMLDVGQGHTIPTLEEAVVACREHGLLLYLELKSGLVIPTVVQTLRQLNFVEYTVVTSFRPDWLAFIKAIEPNLTTSVLFGAPNLDPVALAQAVGAKYVHPAWENMAPQPHRLLTPEWIAKVRAAGLGIIIWHEERPAEIAALRQLGVDAICSDSPDLLR